MKYKGILLDLDDTLYDYDYAHTKALNAAITEKDQETFAEARKQTGEKLKNTAASHNRLLYFQKMLELQSKPPFEALEIYEKYWRIFLENMHFYEKVDEFLESTKDIPICLVTDLTAHIQYRKIKHLNLENYIDALVTSEEAGIEKPATTMFEIALNKLNLQAGDVCMVGDNLKKDIVGASQLGITSYWLNLKDKKEKLKNNMIEIKHFSELIIYLK